MGRPRTFDEHAVLASAGALFVRLGYASTSVDDLVTVLGLHRGSLYQAFGSKRGLFVTALRRDVDAGLPGLPPEADETVASTALDLLLVALLELAPHDGEVQGLVDAAVAVLADRYPDLGPDGPATLLGRRLLARAGHASAPQPSRPGRT